MVTSTAVDLGAACNIEEVIVQVSGSLQN
jgi:hypothetical protein